MTLNYSLSENDYLQHLLFNVTKSENIKKKRRRNRIEVTAAIFTFALIFYISKETYMVYYCILTGFITLIFYPSYERYHYKKHYKKYIAEAYKARANIVATVVLAETSIETYDKTGEAKLNLSELQEIIETNEYFYLKLKIGESIIIPKQKIEHLEALRLELEKLTTRLGILFTADLNWKWK